MAVPFPPPLDAYPALPGAELSKVLLQRATLVPFNAVATAIFVAAVVHTFAAQRFLALGHRVQHRHDARERAAGRGSTPHPLAEILHFLGEVETVFGLWAVVLAVAITRFYGWATTVAYLEHGVSFTEAVFVFAIMVLASTRPIVGLAEGALRRLARLGGGTPAAWWITILSAGSLLGSLITEPAAMTICALLLGRQLYALRPSNRLKYATLGLLFVDVSVGGTLSDFAAPPVLMVARPWGWDLGFMLTHFGWKAAIGIALANGLYFLVFRREFTALAARAAQAPATTETRAAVPAWVVFVHVAAIAWTVANAHHPTLVVGGFLFFLGFATATTPHQNPIELRTPLLVAFFLAGLVVHGNLQGWWIAPVLGSLHAVPLFVGAVVLTAFNDNALITYLATLVPNLAPSLQYVVVAGAVTGGGLTVIANAPNPAGQALLSSHFEEGISPLGLLVGAIPPTLIVGACLLLL